MADQIPTNTAPGAMVTLDDADCPDQRQILVGQHETGETVTCQPCDGEHTITEAVPVHLEIAVAEAGDDEIAG